MPAVTINMVAADLQGIDKILATRGCPPVAQNLLVLDKMHRATLTKCEGIKAKINILSQQIGQALKNGQSADGPKNDVRDLKNELADRTQELVELKEKLDQVLFQLPNLPDNMVPIGADETENVEILRTGSPGDQNTPHWDMKPIQTALELGAKITGTRFSALANDVAILHRAVANFMLDYHGRRGFAEVIPPVMVNRQALVGTGQLPKFEDDLFKINENRYLIPTAEVSLTNLCADEIYKEDITRRMVALTDCFRAEAGAAGRDTRGLIRQHQFQKVELVTVCAEHNSQREHEYMLEGAEGILDNLGLPYRRMLLCSGDMGFSAQRTYDLEVWMPGQNTYREISSVSNCGDFQARRMNIKYKLDGKMQYAHTLNGSGLAVGRTLAAILENYYSDGRVWIPQALVPYTHFNFITVGE
jgi:seryl-tRNA synthetase